MLINYFRHFALLGVFVPRFGESTKSMTFVNDSLVRSEREVGTKYLIFPQGSNVQLVYCLTMSTYTKPQGIFAVGVTAGLAWELPHRNSVPYRKPAEVYHRRSRRELYRKVELMLKTLPAGWYDIDPMTEYERTYHLGENCDEVHAKCPDVF